MSVLSAAHFHDEQIAYAVVEARLWPNGPICPHCGGADRAYALKGASTRIGVRKCGHCRKQFTVKVGTIFEDSHVPMTKWLQAIYLLTCSKKGISSNQLHRILGVTLKTAWFMSHRIREAMRSGGLAPMGGDGGVVEIDETYIGRRKGKEIARGTHHKMPVLALVNRETGESRAFVVDNASSEHILPIVRANVARETHIMTDESSIYRAKIAGDYLGHGVVNHKRGEYGYGHIHTNTVEG